MPREVLLLVIAIVLMHPASLFLPQDLWNALVFVPGRVAPEGVHSLGDLIGQWAPAVTHAFLHAGWIHLFFNAMLILQTGELVAARYRSEGGGGWRFLALFAGAAAAGAFAHAIAHRGEAVAVIGASGAASGLFAGYILAAERDWRAVATDPQAWRMAGLFLFVNVALAFLARAIDVLPIAWEAHLGGFIGGLILYPILLPRRRFGN